MPLPTIASHVAVTRLLTLALAGLLLSACSVGPDYQRPAVASPAAYRHDAGWQPVVPSESAAKISSAGAQHKNLWWQRFADPALASLIEESLKTNPTLAQAEARYRQAWALLRSARAEHWPTVEGNLAANRGRSGSSAIGEQYDASLGLSWTLDLWGRVRRQVEAEQASLQASAADLAAARLSVQLLLAQNYFQLRIIDQQRQLLERTLGNYQRALQYTRNQYAAGVVARADVIQAEMQLEELRLEHYTLGQSRAELEHAIATLLGRPAGDWRWPEPMLEAVLNPSAQSHDADAPAPLSSADLPLLPPSLPSALLLQRPDVAAAERRVAQANANIGVARSAWLPDLSLDASYGGSASRFSRLLESPARVWSLGPSLAATLFDAGRRSASNAQAEAAHDEASASYRETVLTAWQEVEDALAARHWLAARAQQQAHVVALAQENERVVDNRYRAGLVSYLELSNAQSATFDSQRAALDILGEQFDASVRLIVALGGDWQDDTQRQPAGTP